MIYSITYLYFIVTLSLRTTKKLYLQYFSLSIINYGFQRSMYIFSVHRCITFCPILSKVCFKWLKNTDFIHRCITFCHLNGQTLFYFCCNTETGFIHFVSSHRCFIYLIFQRLHLCSIRASSSIYFFDIYNVYNQKISYRMHIHLSY